MKLNCTFITITVVTVSCFDVTITPSYLYINYIYNIQGLLSFIFLIVITVIVIDTAFLHSLMFSSMRPKSLTSTKGVSAVVKGKLKF